MEYDTMPPAYYNLLFERGVTIAQMKLMKGGAVDMSLPVWKESGLRLCNKYITLCNNIILIRDNYSNPPPDFNIFGWSAE
jgi:hypothetical protein